LDRYYAPDNIEAGLINQLNIPVINYDDPQKGKIDYSLSFLPIPKDDGSGPPIGVALIITLGAALPEINIGSISLKLKGDFNLAKRIFVEIRPDNLIAKTDSNGNEINAIYSIEYAPAKPIIVLGTETSTCLQISDFTITLSVLGSVLVTLEVDIKKMELVMDYSDSDSLVQSIAGNSLRSLEFPVGLSLSNKKGLTFKGLDIPIDIHKTFGALHIDSLSLNIAPSDNSGLELVMS
jgi:hypothetical protein